MCTVVLLRRPRAPWPLLLAANRDELRSRPWRPPARHWPDRPEVVAGLDVQAGGSWLGVNDDGVVAAVLNRVGSLGPAIGKRSRGELVLEALDHADAATAASALTDLNPEAYRPFNLLVADRRDAFWLRHAGGLPRFGYRDRSGAWQEVDAPWLPRGEGRSEVSAPAVECTPLPEGCSMLTARDLNDATSPRVRAFLPRFQQAAPPDPGVDDWQAWIGLLGRRADPGAAPGDGMTIETEGDFGTVCSSLIALPARGAPIMKFAAGPPDRTPFERVAL
ncbi:MAG TPA: NRDE family protein [Geminicoccaceae bacterium]|nr:NRDE family protein [Geminicoccaceae bacterium]